MTTEMSFGWAEVQESRKLYQNPKKEKSESRLCISRLLHVSDLNHWADIYWLGRDLRIEHGSHRWQRRIIPLTSTLLEAGWEMVGRVGGEGGSLHH